jgi:altronate dehydratase
MESDGDFVFKYLEEFSHEKDLLDRIKAQIVEKEEQLAQINESISAADKKISLVEKLSISEESKFDEIDIEPELHEIIQNVRVCDKAILYYKLTEKIKSIHQMMNVNSKENIEETLSLGLHI